MGEWVGEWAKQARGRDASGNEADGQALWKPRIARQGWVGTAGAWCVGAWVQPHDNDKTTTRQEAERASKQTSE